MSENDKSSKKEISNESKKKNDNELDSKIVETATTLPSGLSKKIDSDESDDDNNNNDNNDKKEEKPNHSIDVPDDVDISAETLADNVDLLSRLFGSVDLQASVLPPPPKIETLNGDPLSLENIAKAIKAGRIKKVIVLTGAGISVAAGIPDFRTPGTGLYDNLQKYNLPYPEAIFQLDYFKENPKPFYLLAKEMLPGSFKPTLAHFFIALLAQKGLLVRNYTQNIDTLERVAGIDGDLLVEAHGSFGSAHCTSCHADVATDKVRRACLASEVCRCEHCDGVVKPDIVFFGESLPARYFQLSVKDFKDCDLLLVMGTSLQVQPFANLISAVKNTCLRVLINRERVAVASSDSLMSRFGAEGSRFVFDGKRAYRDVDWLGDVQEGVTHLASLLGWRDDLLALAARWSADVSTVFSATNDDSVATDDDDNTDDDDKNDNDNDSDAVDPVERAVARAAATIAAADCVLLTNGAGLGVDSGLPDFRGKEGFWRAYPPIQKLGLAFPQVSTPKWFKDDPEFAFGFWYHRWQLYNDTKQHDGFQLLLDMCRNGKQQPPFVYTSNIDGHWHRVYDEDKITEVHGSINFLQCCQLGENVGEGCKQLIWDAADQMKKVKFDEKTFRADLDSLPKCMLCNGLARPNVMMFSDSTFIEDRTDAQEERFEKWLSKAKQEKWKIAIIEIGAGVGVPTIRMLSERVARVPNATLIRVNPRDKQVLDGHISLPLGGLDAIKRIDAILKKTNNVE